jgi:hypothetical protein
MQHGGDIRNFSVGFQTALAEVQGADDKLGQFLDQGI